jgi:hypothetical protein
MSRQSNYISRDITAYDSGDREPSWFADYVKNLEKAAVRSKKDDIALFDQINSILGNKSKYSNVEEAVLDMQRRTGLLDLVNKRKAAQAIISKKYENSKLLNEIPNLKTFIDNYIESRPGTSVDAVAHDLLRDPAIKDKLPQGDDIPDEIRRYINDKLLENDLMHPSEEENFQLGKVDVSTDDNTSSDNDPFSGCQPVTNK